MILFPKKKYKIIYADPPYYFKTYSKKGEDRGAVNHYDCMQIDDIYNLPVSSISDDNCCLFLWVISPLLEQGFEVIKKWGFKYKTVGFTWVKTNIWETGSYFTGMGYWTRANPEICLLATKGHPKRVSKKVKQLIFSPRQAHSKKPDCVRDKIVELVGDIPRIELFARPPIPKGWDSWGNEV